MTGFLAYSINKSLKSVKLKSLLNTNGEFNELVEEWGVPHDVKKNNTNIEDIILSIDKILKDFKIYYNKISFILYFSFFTQTYKYTW